MLVNADFHLHSCFSAASSKDMVIRNMAPKAKLKGLGLLGTGDALHPGWLDIIEETTSYSGDGIYTFDESMAGQKPIMGALSFLNWPMNMIA